MLAFSAAVSVALIVSFVCSILESVLLSVGHARVEALAAGGKRSGFILRDFKRRIDVPIAAILIVNTMAHTVGAAVAGATYESVFDPSTLWIFTIVFTVAVLFFTEIVPKTLGVAHANTLATPVAYGIYALTVVLRPFVLLSERISRALRRGQQAPVTSIEEIRLLASLGRSEGIVGPRLAEIIVGATRLRELRAADVMVPRASVTLLSASSTREEIAATVRASGHSRFPFVPGEDHDEVTGIVLAKDLLHQLLERPQQSVDWSALVREPLVVPPGKPLNALLRSFQESRTHMALVIDEYGGFAGIVTMEDVLEEMLGEIEDEGDEPVQEIVPQPDGTLQVRGSAEIRKLIKRLKVAHGQNSEAVTVGGLIVDLLGRMAARGDTVEWNGYLLEVLSVSARRVELVRVRAAAHGEGEPTPPRSSQ
jgi:putative hemolysin